MKGTTTGSGSQVGLTTGSGSQVGLWMRIADSVRSAVESGELPPGERLPSDAEMAARWSVSPMTVHRAMQELQREGLVARRRKAGTFVAERRAPAVHRMALIFSAPSDAPQSGYVEGIHEVLGDTYRLFSLASGSDPRLEAAYLRQAAEEADALICYPTGAIENTPLLRQIARQKPMAFVDRQVAGVEADVVMTDNKASVLSGLQFLASRGHQRIAYFVEEQIFPVSSVQERLQGYQEFISGHQEVVPEHWIQRVPRTLSDEAYFVRVEEQLAQLLGGPHPVTAVLCQQDQLMAAVLEACVHLKVSVPEQLEVMSFSDLDPALLPLGRSAHRLVQRATEMGSIAARRLKLRLATPELRPQVVRLQADLVEATYRRARTPEIPTYLPVPEPTETESK